MKYYFQWYNLFLLWNSVLSNKKKKNLSSSHTNMNRNRGPRTEVQTEPWTSCPVAPLTPNEMDLFQSHDCRFKSQSSSRRLWPLTFLRSEYVINKWQNSNYAGWQYMGNMFLKLWKLRVNYHYSMTNVVIVSFVLTDKQMLLNDLINLRHSNSLVSLGNKSTAFDMHLLRTWLMIFLGGFFMLDRPIFLALYIFKISSIKSSQK